MISNHLDSQLYLEDNTASYKQICKEMLGHSSENKAVGFPARNKKRSGEY